jgi:Uma2 family endonuclease
MAVERRFMTAEEFLALPDDGVPRELIDGAVRVLVPPGGPHGRAGGSMLSHLGRFVYDKPVAEVFLAETGFLLRRDPGLVRAPDVSVVRVERIPPEGLPQGYVPFPPDLAVEVVSPSDTASDVLDKVQDWLRFGVKIVWVVYGTPVYLFIHRADGTVQGIGPDDEVTGEDVLPGFAMRLRDLLHPFRR